MTVTVGLRPDAGVRLLFKRPAVEPISFLDFQDYLTGARDLVVVCFAASYSPPSHLLLARLLFPSREPSQLPRFPVFTSRLHYRRFRDALQQGLSIVALRYESPVEIYLGVSTVLVVGAGSAAMVSSRVRQVFEDVCAIRTAHARTGRDVSKLTVERQAYEVLAQALSEPDQRRMKGQLTSAARVLAELEDVN